MEKIINKLFGDYLSQQDMTKQKDFSLLSKNALSKEQELREKLDSEQTKYFEQLFEITSQIHFLEVKEAFFNGCKIGARESKEFAI